MASLQTAPFWLRSPTMARAACCRNELSRTAALTARTNSSNIGPRHPTDLIVINRDLILPREVFPLRRGCAEVQIKSCYTLTKCKYDVKILIFYAHDDAVLMMRGSILHSHSLLQWSCSLYTNTHAHALAHNSTHSGLTW